MVKNKGVEAWRGGGGGGGKGVGLGGKTRSHHEVNAVR